jgi:4-hydroxy-tetrahydrodipicolinate reductase
MGNIVGEHEVIIGTATQTITLKHEAHNRALFAEGAIAAADFLIGQPAGMYDMKSMLSGERVRDAVISAE